MKFGQFEIFQISEGLFHLTDSLLEEFLSSDAAPFPSSDSQPKRIAVGINTLVVRNKESVILCDTGVGTEKPKNNCYYPKPVRDHLPLERQLKQLGISPKDVTHVIMTHLHNDHSGGLACFDDKKIPSVAYPNASIIIQKDEWEAVQEVSHKDNKEYCLENLTCLQKSPNAHLITGDETVLPGISLLRTNGHTSGHQIIKIDSGNGQVAAYFGDLMPTPAFFNKNIKLKFDYDPEKAQSMRKKLTEQAVAEDWLLFFYHAPNVKAGKAYLKSDSTMKVKKFDHKDLYPY